MPNQPGTILVVDDNPMNRKVLLRNLQVEGYPVAQAENGLEALAYVRAHPCDVMLLDLMMPEMDGYQVLAALQADEGLRHLPVIVISALDEVENIVRCIEMGAADYLTKPFDPVLLRARINASLANKRLRDLEQAYVKRIQAEQEESERLLLNVLPWPIAERLKRGEQTIADTFSEVTVLFADIVDFTALAARWEAAEVVALLNNLFSTFDRLVEHYGLEKIKTIGDAYMVAGGLPTPRPDHAEAVADMALAMQNTFAAHKSRTGNLLRLRIGIHTGSVVAGVIGTKKFAYDLWGDTVNLASRMESHGLSGHIQVSPATYARLHPRYLFEPRGATAIKGHGTMQTYFLMGKQAAP